MLRSMEKKRIGSETQKTAPEQAVHTGGGSNQAMLAMLESPRAQTAAQSSSGGTPLADAMRAKFERQFSMSMDDVRVHYNSDEPAKFDAGAYTYGSHIFIGPSQEKLLEHEIGHVVQQKRGVVRPTGREHGLAVNRSPVLEHSADTGDVTRAMGRDAEPVVQCHRRDRKQYPAGKNGEDSELVKKLLAKENEGKGTTQTSFAGNKIPSFLFADIKDSLPDGLKSLLRDIYRAWINDKVFDQRTNKEREAKSINSTTAGTLRSYHMNLQGTLPMPRLQPMRDKEANQNKINDTIKRKLKNSLDEPKLDGQRGKELHDHYKETSQQDINATAPQKDGKSYPIGLAEYTGIGFGGEPDGCKIVLDYINGELYLTLTHYQYYTVDDQGQVERLGKSRDVSSSCSQGKKIHQPWFKIKMQ